MLRMSIHATAANTALPPGAGHRPRSGLVRGQAFSLGRAWRRFYDICMLSRNYDFDGDRLSRAIAATFERRRSAIPGEVPDALTSAFSSDATKQRQWAVSVRDLVPYMPSLETIVNDRAVIPMPQAGPSRQQMGAADRGTP